ncbi:MAG: ABC transporter ATP-binding protein [Alphaproteobacteria bacterium]|nr:ABC transporter ATP-binding protein [Alphaproteobacteria bacterium]
MSSPVLELREVSKRFGTRKHPVWALSGISLHVHAGETLGIVGESGSGKSTVARIAVGLELPTAGSATVMGRPISEVRGKGLIQMVFQDPSSSLNPLLRVAPSVREPLDAVSAQPVHVSQARVISALEEVGLDRHAGERFPGALSGGQKQRVSIARALSALPPVIVCDEAVTALDVSIRAQILNLLREVQSAHATACLFISHDLCTVAYMSDRIVVMYLGKIVEVGTTAQLLGAPAHPYTYALLSAVPKLQQGRHARKRIRLCGDPPSVMQQPRGCRFHSRCPTADERCRDEEPAMRKLHDDHFAACHYAPVEESKLAALAAAHEGEGA